MDQTTSGDARVPLIRNTLRRFGILIVLVTVLVTAAAALLVSHSSRSYTAQAVILLKPVTGNPLDRDSAVNGAQLNVAMQTEAGLVDSPDIVVRTSDEQGIDVHAWAIQAQVPANSQIINISYTAKSPTEAADGAEAVADSFLSYRHEHAVQARQDTLDSLNRQRVTAENELAKASLQAEKNSNPTSFAAQSVQLYANQLATLDDSISQVQSESTDAGSVVSSAAAPAKANGLPPWIVVAVVGLLALLASIGIAAWLEWRADRFHARDEIEVAGVPVLSHIPRSKSRAPRGEADPVVEEAYRRLRAGVLAVSTPPQVLAVVAVSRSRQAAVVTANLSRTLAAAGFSVIAVSADPTDRELEFLMSVPATPGLSDLVQGTVEVDECLHRSGDVLVIAGGSEAESTHELYAGPAFNQVMDDVRPHSSFVLVSAARATSSAADSIAAVADHALLVVSDGETRHRQVETALQRMRRMGVDVVGAVSIAPSRRSDLSPAKPGAEKVTRHEETVETVETAEESGDLAQPGPAAEETLARPVTDEDVAVNAGDETSDGTSRTQRSDTSEDARQREQEHSSESVSSSKRTRRRNRPRPDRRHPPTGSNADISRANGRPDPAQSEVFSEDDGVDSSEAVSGAASRRGN